MPTAGEGGGQQDGSVFWGWLRRFGSGTFDWLRRVFGGSKTTRREEREFGGYDTPKPTPESTKPFDALWQEATREQRDLLVRLKMQELEVPLDLMGIPETQ